jgi:hypothetical protein
VDEDNENICQHFLYIMPASLHTYETIITQRLWNFQRVANQNGGVHMLTHPYVRNYQRFALHNYHIEPQIVEIIDGPGDFATAVIKTHFIRLIQRKWKRIYAERQRVLALRKHPSSLYFRRIYGSWPSSCAKYI